MPGCCPQMDDVELVGVVDPVPAARDSAAAECHAPAFADHQRLLGRIDAAVDRHAHALSSRRGAGLAAARHAAAGRKAALRPSWPKPTNWSKRPGVHGVVLQVGHIERFNPAFLAAHARVGQPQYIEAVRASGFTGRSTDIGVVLDLMIHDIDLVLSLVDAPLSARRRPWDWRSWAGMKTWRRPAWNSPTAAWPT